MIGKLYFQNESIMTIKNKTICNQLILASQSPRRYELLNWTGLPFQVQATHVDEQPNDHESPATLAARLALFKARAASSAEGEWILAADTVVAVGDLSLGKPSTEKEARIMLNQLHNNLHEVHTGIALRDPGKGREVVCRVTTRVWMRDYTDAEIEAYIHSGDPFDKAGGYAIQHAGFHPVQQIDCCYANVVGLPLCAVLARLRDWGIHIPLDIPTLCRQHFGYLCPAMDEGIIL